MITPCPTPAIFRRATAFSARVELSADLGPRAAELIGRELPGSLGNAIARRKTEYVAGRYCAREALVIAKGGTGARAAEIRARVEAPGEEGRLPAWPPGFVGSITHKGGYVSAAVARDRVLRGLGIDSERQMSDIDALKLRESIATARERELLRELAEADASRGHAAAGPGLLYTILFSSKESLFKALFPGVRVFFGFMDAELVSLSPARDGGVPSARMRLLRSLSAEFQSGWECEARYEVAGGWVHSAIEVGA